MSARRPTGVGYLHIPDMGQPGLNEFTRKPVASADSQGKRSLSTCAVMAVVFVSQLVIERLRHCACHGRGRSPNGVPQTDPPQAFLGPLVSLINEFSASDGDTFPYRFKALGLGRVDRQTDVGRLVIGVRDPLPGWPTAATFPARKFAPYSKEGKGRGSSKATSVDPDHCSSMPIPRKETAARRHPDRA